MSNTQKKICPVVRKKTYLSPLLKNDYMQIVLELKPRIVSFSLLYANIDPKWNTMISYKGQGPALKWISFSGESVIGQWAVVSMF